MLTVADSGQTFMMSAGTDTACASTPPRRRLRPLSTQPLPQTTANHSIAAASFAATSKLTTHHSRSRQFEQRRWWSALGRILLVTVSVILSGWVVPSHALTAIFADNSTVYCPAVTSSYFLGPQSFSFRARAIWAQPSNGCDLSDEPGVYAGKLVLTSLGSCSPETRVRAAQRVGARGVLTFNNKLSESQIGEEVYVFDGTDRSKLVLPSLLMSKECQSIVYDRSFSNPQPIDLLPSEIVEFEFSPGPQIWIDHYNSVRWFVFMKVIIPIWSGLNFGVAVWKLYGFIRSQRGFRCNSLSQWTLILTALSNAERCWYSPLFFLAGPDPIFPNVAGNILLSISAPTELSATLLAMFFWAHASDLGRGRVVSPLDRYKRAIAVGTVLLFLTDIGSAVSQGLYQNISVIAAALRGCVYLLFSTVLGGGFLFFGFKQLSALARYATRTEEQKRIGHIARWMALSGWFRLLSLGTVSLAVVPGFIWDFDGLCAFIFGAYLSLNAISTCQLTMLQVPRVNETDTYVIITFFLSLLFLPLFLIFFCVQLTFALSLPVLLCTEKKKPKKKITPEIPSKLRSTQNQTKWITKRKKKHMKFFGKKKKTQQNKKLHPSTLRCI